MNNFIKYRGRGVTFKKLNIECKLQIQINFLASVNKFVYRKEMLYRLYITDIPLKLTLM